VGELVDLVGNEDGFEVVGELVDLVGNEDGFVVEETSQGRKDRFVVEETSPAAIDIKCSTVK